MSTHSGNNRRRQLFSIDSNNPTKKKNFENESPSAEPAGLNSGMNSTVQGFTGTAGYVTLNNSVSENQ